MTLWLLLYYYFIILIYQVNACNSNPCLNGATCIISESEHNCVWNCIASSDSLSYTCKCTSGFNCQISNFQNINIFHLLNATKTNNKFNTTETTTKPKTTTKTTSTPKISTLTTTTKTTTTKSTNACTINPCLNGATCQVNGNGNTYVCVCASAYSGSNCQTCKQF